MNRKKYPALAKSGHFVEFKIEYGVFLIFPCSQFFIFGYLQGANARGY
jgi:hypothetical protein